MKGALLRCLLLVFSQSLTLAYKAGVYEYFSDRSDTSLNTILTNINDYASFADNAFKQKADILVFPEYGLTTLDYNLEDSAIEISTANDVIKRLHDIAVVRHLYLVVNLLEKVQEKNTATKYYNTNLVFNRTGDIILKYRKINLFNEEKLTAGEENQTVTFSTDFNVTFGIFTSYDILFENPSRKVLNNTAVTDIVYPTALQASLPFFSTLSVQHGYSLANGVNLLAAGYGRPSEGYGGSGIYLYNGNIADVYIADTPSSKPIVQEVTKINSRYDTTRCANIVPFGLPDDVGKSNVTNYIPRKDFRASDYTFKKVDLSTRNSTIEVCDGDFCCTFDITLNPDSVGSSDKYKVMAFDGSANYNTTRHHLRICSLLACENDSPDSCGNKLNSTNTKFTKLTVKGNLDTEQTYYMPITTDTNLLPIRSTFFCNYHNDTDRNTSFVQLTTIQAQENILVFGIVGKDQSSTASSVQVFGVLFLIVLSIVKSIVF